MFEQMEVSDIQISEALWKLNASSLDEQTKNVLSSVSVLLMNRTIELEQERQKNKGLVKSLININSLPKNNTVCTMTLKDGNIDIPFIGDPLIKMWVTKQKIKSQINTEIWRDVFLEILEERRQHADKHTGIEPTSHFLTLWKEKYIVCISVSKDRSENIFSNTEEEKSFIEKEIQGFTGKNEDNFIYWVYFIRMDFLDNFFRKQSDFNNSVLNK